MHDIRLVLKEEHETHKHIIQWDTSKTDFGIPYTITGLSKMTTFFMKTIFNHWDIMYFMNYYLGGAILASIELDYLPGENSAGFFALHADKSIDKMTDEEVIEAGMQIQRVWLYLTQLNLSVQPCYTPIIISYYLRNGRSLTDNKKINSKIHKLSKKFEELGFSDKTFFIARVGYPITTDRSVRSTRLGLETLILSHPQKE